MTCDDFELHAEMRLHGALEPARIAELDEHLARCPSCREFETNAKKQEATMVANGMRGVDRIDWQRITTRARERTPRQKRDLWRMAMAAPALVALIVWATGGDAPWTVAGFASLLAVAILGWGVWRTRQLDRDARAAERTRDDLLAFYRRDLDATIRRARASSICCLVAAFSSFLPLALAGRRSAMTLRELFFWMAFGVFSLGYAVYAEMLLRRCRRERMELE